MQTSLSVMPVVSFLLLLPTSFYLNCSFFFCSILFYFIIIFVVILFVVLFSLLKANLKHGGVISVANQILNVTISGSELRFFGI